MITKGDDYPIHQTPEPIAYSGTDQNFYDRYFFCGYSREGEHYFAAALGVYPHLNIMDASFCVIDNGTQHNIHASRVLHAERMDTRVGPISIDVIEPLKKLAVKLEDNKSGIRADVTFEARAMPVEEPRFTRRNGPQTMFNYTRMTQNGAYSGRIEVGGRRIEISNDRFLGTRDRSWGVRPVGAMDTRPSGVKLDPQFYWLWAPINFDDCATFYALNADREGMAWHKSACLAPLGDVEPQMAASSKSTLTFKSGTRHAKSAEIEMAFDHREDVRISLEPQYNFYMSGLGYLNPEWNHGAYKGEEVTGYDSIDPGSVDENTFPFLHVQAFCKARMLHEGGEKQGVGILEQLILGPHKPSGFKSILDPAP